MRPGPGHSNTVTDVARAVLLLAIWLLATIGGAKLLTAADRPGLDLHGHRIELGIVAATVIALAAARTAAREYGFRGFDLGAAWRGSWLPLSYAVLFIAIGMMRHDLPTGVLLTLFANSMLAGISEETMFRGILLTTLWKHFGPRPAVIVVSAGFGLAHVLNSILTGDLAGASHQAVLALVLGLAFVVSRLKSRSVLPAMVVHGLWDFGLLINIAGSPQPLPVPAGGLLPFLSQLVLVAPLLMWSLYNLKRLPHRLDG